LEGLGQELGLSLSAVAKVKRAFMELLQLAPTATKKMRLEACPEGDEEA